MEYVLETEGLCKSYGHFRALDELTMHVPRGAIYGFIGKNGAGKTTFIRVACGLQRPDSGSIRLYGASCDAGGRETEALMRARRRMGAIVESPSVYLGMTAEENLRQQYLVLGRPSYDGITELLELVGLSGTGKKRAGDFSLGMRQRLGIAVALAGNPDFLALDEPVNGLDPQGIIELRELMLRLNREREITVLISSHILDELSRLATHYGFLDRGRLVKEMSADQLMQACRKCLRVEVTDVRALAPVLDARGLSYTVLTGTEAEIYGEIGITELTLALAERGCEVRSVEKREESLESYYIRLLGGEEHA